ncbi:hypothetical protein JW960_10445 [candidate division KSB1 bacterium]|nr:hypothetical protein [candidate division KSB1 bacterium]
MVEQRSRGYFTLSSLMLLLMALLIFSSCNKKSVPEGQVQNSTSQKITASQSVMPFKIRIAEGGGFTGQTSGYTLAADGTLTHWQQLPGQPEKVVWTRKVDAGKVSELKHQLDDSDIVGKQWLETGNMTTSLTYESGSTTHMWSWAGTGTDGKMPEELKAWYTDFKSVCKQN